MTFSPLQRASRKLHGARGTEKLPEGSEHSGMFNVLPVLPTRVKPDARHRNCDAPWGVSMPYRARKSVKNKVAEESAPYGKHEKKLRFIDLFCGIGGFRIAFAKQGCECLFFRPVVRM